MEPKLQTKVTDQNRFGLHSNVYNRTTKTKDQLIQLDNFNSTNFIIVDSGAQQYRQFWPNVNIVELEALNTIKSFNATPANKCKLLDDRVYNDIKWPTVNVLDCALIFDYSTFLKYRTVSDIVNLISFAANKYNANDIVFRSLTMFVDDARLTDRFENLSQLMINGYIVTEFNYNVKHLTVSYRKKYQYE